MHRLGIEPRSTGWKPVILPLNYRCSRGIYIICVLNISTPEKGFEPLTSSLGGKRSIQAELPGHKLSRINRFKNYAGEIKFFGIFNLPYLMREKGSSKNLVLKSTTFCCRSRVLTTPATTIQFSNNIFRFAQYINAGERIRTFVSTKLTDLESVPFDHSGTPA